MGARHGAAMSFAAIGEREGISGADARLVYLSAMKKLRGYRRREIVSMLKFYGDQMDIVRAAADSMEAR